MKNILYLVTAFTLLNAGSALASSMDWDREIERTKRASSDYYEYVRERDGSSPHVGSMYSGYHFERHQCAIIGRMLGMDDVVSELERITYPPMDETSDTQDLLVFSVSLENWVAAAEGALKMDESRRRSVWNLDCVGSHGISKNYFIENAMPEAQFEIKDGTLYIYGDIDHGFYLRFKVALTSGEPITRVALGSGGGSVIDALMTGREIRTRGLDTTIYGNCFSACPLVFMGGEARLLWASPSRLGFHQVSSDGKPVPLDDDIYSLISQYVNAMGVDTSLALTWMKSAPLEDMYEPSPLDLCISGVATWIQRVCGG